MYKFNLLHQLVPAGVVALGTIFATAGSMLVAPSAQAQITPVSCFIGGLDQLLMQSSVQCLDKLFSNFTLVPSPPTPLGVIAAINFTAAGNFTFTLSTPTGTPGPGQVALGFDVEITDPNKFFDQVALDSDTDRGPGAGNVSVTKGVLIEEIFSGPIPGKVVAVGDLITLLSLNGAPTPPKSILGATSISVTDTIVGGVGSTIFSVTDSFNQGEGEVVPEPASILGLLAVGGLGLSLKRKKQL